MHRTPRTPRLRHLATLAVLVLVMAACGQKADVAQVSASGGGGGGGGGGFGDGGGGSFDDLGDGGGDFGSTDGSGGSTDGSTGGDGTTGGSTGGSTDGSTGGSTGGDTGGDTGGSTGGGGGGGGEAPQQGGGAAPPGDRTGIGEDVIKIGVHAPVTGAAPIPQTSFEDGIDLYWKFVQQTQGGLFGKRVQVIFRDDQFDPRTAISVCKEMVEQEKVFLLVGGGGADQITACANYANSVGVPYLSGGVNEKGLAGIRAYFALSQTYSQQSKPITQYITKNFGKKPIYVAVSDSGAFDDAFASIKRELQAAGFNIVGEKRMKGGDPAASIASDMQTSGAEIVYFLSSPQLFLEVANATGPTYNPQWIGPGLTSGLNTVASIGCRAGNSIEGAVFFSPFMQLDAIDRFDPNYKKTAQSEGVNADDLGIALWGLNKSLHQMFLKAGETVSRQSFVQTLEGGSAFESNVFPVAKYSAQNHFGANSSHVLKADCASSTYKTVATFASGF